MARIRTVKPEFFRHEMLQDIERNNPGSYAMLSYIGIWSLCDKSGRFEWKPRLMKLDILPFLDFDFEKTLLLLERFSFVSQYSLDGKLYGLVHEFTKHQRINGKEAQDPSKYPEPKEFNNLINGSSREAIGKQQRSQEGKGREGEQEGEQEGEGEGKGKGKGKGKGMDIASPDKSGADANQVVEIFEYWKTTLCHPRAILDDKRKKLIKHWLTAGYKSEDLIAAIRGCSLTPHNIGQNDQGQRFDSIELIFRNAAQIDRFIQNSITPPKRETLSNFMTADQRRMASTDKAIEDWLNEGSIIEGEKND